MHKAHEVTIESVPDAAISEQTDAVIRVTRACICGSDLWPYNDLPQTPGGRPMGHEAIGFVEDVGGEVQSIRRGQLVIMPFAYSDGTCTYCRNQLQTSCIQGGFFGSPEVGGAQAEALRIPFADGTLYPISAEVDDSLMPALLTLSDVMGTGHHAALTARVAKGGSVAVIGDGAVGLLGVLSAKQMAALKKAKGAQFDRLFLAGMVQHHKGALTMVKDLFDTAGAGQDAELFNFASEVDSGQRAEIRIMQTMLGQKPEEEKQ